MIQKGMLHELSHFVPLSRSLNNRLFKGECNTCTISFILGHSVVKMGVDVDVVVEISRKNVVFCSHTWTTKSKQCLFVIRCWF